MKSFKSFVVACLEYAAVFIICFVAPAIVASIIAFDGSIYFSCIHSAAYVGFISFLSLFATVGYGIYKEEHSA